MKWLNIVWLVAIYVSAVHAVECGPFVQVQKLDQLQSSVRFANGLLTQHRESLQREVSGLLGYAPTQATLNEVDRINREDDLLKSADASVVEMALQNASILAAVRDVMVDQRDRVIVEKYLSISVFGTKRLAEIKLRYLNQILAKISRPGVAIDVSRLRDEVGAIASEFEKCESPKPLTTRKPQRVSGVSVTFSRRALFA